MTPWEPRDVPRVGKGCPPSDPGNTRSRGDTASVFSLGAVEISIVEAEAEKREGVVAAATPDLYGGVEVSTRFMTPGGWALTLMYSL